MRPLALLLALVALLLASAAPAAADGLRNPILPASAEGDDSPDPWLFRHAGRYWVTSTTSGRIEVRSARTLAGLSSATPKRLWSAQGEPPERATELWAPEIHRIGGRWYVYYTAKGASEGFVHRMYVLESAGGDPAGPYRFKGQIAVPQPYAIDATVATIGGRPYLLYAGGQSFTPTSIYLAPLADPVTVASTPVEISQPTRPWEMVGVAINEGPEVLQHDGRVHVIFSASHCSTGEYALGRLTVGQGANLMDPATWQAAKHPDPVFATSRERRVFGPGHGSFFTSPDGRESWMVYHATENKKGCFTGGLRTTRVQRFTWRADGTPDFGTPIGLGTDTAAPGGDGTVAVQAEDRGAGRKVTDRRLFGYRGLATRAARLRVRVPRAGRYAVRVRVLATPKAGKVTVTLPGGRTVRRSARRASTQAVELDAGTVRLPRGRATIGVRATSTTTVDQVLLERR
jgi:GH43 family beta-xylosidase